MKVRIKTAHGYLSFQPGLNGDPNGAVTVQYRPSPGAWEEIDLEGLELPPAPGPGPTPPSGVGIPAAIQPVERTAAYISRVKNWLQSQGVSLSGPCGAFAIVKHAAWYLRPTYPTVGLLDKPGGNQCEGFATDILMFSDMQGQIIDVLSDGGGTNGPTWHVSDTVDPARWRPPVQP